MAPVWGRRLSPWRFRECKDKGMHGAERRSMAAPRPTRRKRTGHHEPDICCLSVWRCQNVIRSTKATIIRAAGAPIWACCIFAWNRPS